MSIPRALAPFLFLLLAVPLSGSNYTVNDLGDAPDATPGDDICASAGAVCTLRAAIEEANAHAGDDSVAFSVAGTIAPGTPLPAIVSRVVIDATSAPGYAGAPVVILQGTETGLTFAAGSSESRLTGLKIHGCSLAAVSIATSNITLTRNHLGPIGGGIANGIGVHVGATSCTIGGSSGDGNVISGNRNGVNVHGDGNTVLGNLIGTDASGAAALPNEVGVEVVTSSGVTIGAAGGGMNVISGNTVLGILTSESTDVIITGNRIGTDVTGMIDLGNEIGVSIDRGSNHDISSNLISGSARWGLFINTPQTRVYGNTIGRNASSTGPLPNDWGGISVSSIDCVIGTPELGGNIIASNRREAGVIVRQSAGFVTITANSIFANEAGSFEAGLGIELLDDSGYGPDTNDPLDADAGPNGMQNFPVITSGVTTPTESWIAGSLHSTPATAFALHFYSSAAADPTGFGEGETYLGTTAVLTDASGNATFDWNGPPLTPGHFLTATATGPTGTSEFSQAEAVIAAPSIHLSSSSYATAESGGSVTITVVREGDLSVTSTVAYATSDDTATAPSDYASASGTLTFAPGQVSQMFAIAIVSDAIDEPIERFNVTLSNATSASITSPENAAVTIDDPRVDLSISKSGTHVGGQQVEFILAVRNAGPDPATSVSITDVLPSGTTFVSATPSSGSCSGTTTVVCTIPLLPAGDAATISIVVMSSTGEAVTNTAVVTASEIDSDLSNNSATATANAATIPTVSTWGLIALMAMLAAISMARM